MSQTEIIFAFVLGITALLGFFALGVLSYVYDMKEKRYKDEQLERIANACFGIEKRLEEVRAGLLSLSTISSDIDRIEVHQHSFFECAVELGNKVLDEIKKVGD